MSGASPESSDASVFQPGQVIDDKYKIVRVIGRGGMGVVYEAHHELLAQSVALKVVLPEIANNKEVLSRFMNEARNSAKIESDHVARVMDVGVLASGAPFMVMELLAGQDLDAIITQEGSLSATRIADLMLETLEGVASAHAIGIIHRDLKPGNLFLAQKVGRAQRVKVLDFGISKAIGAQQFRGGHVTSTSAIVGSPAYMSPEQLRSSKQVDGRADIWSLGVILYQLATGVLPYNADSVGALFADILETVPTPPRQKQPNVPPALDQLIMKCLQKRPEDRFQSALDLALALAPMGTSTAARALERIQTLAIASLPATSAGALASATPSSRESSPEGSGPVHAFEAYAATHISDPHVEAKLVAAPPIDSSARIPAAAQSAPGAPASVVNPARTDGSWASQQRPNAPKKMSIVPFLVGGVVLFAIGGAAIAYRTTRAHSGSSASATASISTSISTTSDPGDTHASRPMSTLGSLSVVAPAVPSASVTPVPSTLVAVGTASAAASAEPRKSGKSSTNGKTNATLGSAAPAASTTDDLFRRF